MPLIPPTAASALWLLLFVALLGRLAAQGFDPVAGCAASPNRFLVCDPRLPNTTASYTVPANTTVTISNCTLFNCPRIVVYGSLSLLNVTFRGLSTRDPSNSSLFPTVPGVQFSADVHPGAVLWVRSGGSASMRAVALRDTIYLDTTLVKVDQSASLSAHDLHVSNAIPLNAAIDAHQLGVVMVLYGEVYVNITNFSVQNISTSSKNGAAVTYWGAINGQGTMNITVGSVRNVVSSGGSSVFFGTHNAKMFMTNFSCSALSGGGCVYLEVGSVGILTNFHIANSHASLGIGIFTEFALVKWLGGSCRNLIADTWGCCGYIQSPYGLGGFVNPSIVQDVMVRNVTAQTGGSFFLNINAEVIFNRLDVEGSYSTQEAGVFYLWQGDVMKVYNSIFNTVLSGGQGGFASIQELSIATFQNVSVYSSTSQGDGGAIVLTDSNSTLIDCRFFNTSTLTGMGGAVFSYIASHPNRPNTLAVINSTINTASTTETGGCLAVAYGGQLVLQDSSLINCVATSGGAIGLIGTDPVSRCNLTFAGINWIEGTTANNGGALYVKGTGVITFLPGGSTTSIASNASANGGFIFLGGQTSLIINHPVYFGGNVAELGSAFYIVQGMDLTISHPQDNLRGSGDFFVVNLPFALSFQQHPAYSFLSSELDMKSEPMYLRTSNQNWTTPLQSIGLSSLIPWFAVEAIDAFGNVADTNLAAPVIMVIRATNGSSWVNSNSNLTVPLSGETTKAILTSSKLVNFTDLAIQSGIGNYSIIAALISGIVPINGVESWPLFNVTVDHVCEAGYGMVASGISQNCVLCSKGTYSIAATKQPCLACPDGAVCLGGSGIKAMAGYYQSMDSRGQPYFQLCPLPQSCCVSGGCARSDSDVCSANMAGFLCADCVASSYYWGYKCVPYNPEESIHYAVYIVLGSIGYIICTILVPPKPLRWINDIWFFLQACSLMSYGSDDWMTYLHIFRFDLDFPASAALVPLSGSLKGMFKYTWVALLLGLVVFLNLFVQVVDVLVPGIATTPRFWCHGRSIKSALRWSTLHLVEISFVPLIAMSLWIVNCVSVTLPNGNRSLFMRSSPSEQCFTGSHVTASAIAITVLAITIIVYPLLIWFIGRTSMRLRLQQAGAQASFTNAASFLDLIYYMFFSELRAKHAWIFVYSHFTRAILITIASTATSNAYQTSVILFINSFVLLVPYVVLSPFAVSTRNLLKEAILMSLCAVGLLRSCSSIIQFYAQNLEDLDDFLSMFSVDNIQIFVLIFMAAPFCTLFSIQFLDSRAGKALVAKLKAGQDDRSDEHSISKSGVGRRLDDIDKDRCNLKDPKKATSLDVPALTAHAETIERRLSTRKIKIRDADPRRRSE